MMKTDIKKTLLILLVLLSCYNVLAQEQQSLSAQDVASNTTPVDQTTPTPTQQQTTEQQPTATTQAAAATTQDNSPTTTNAPVDNTAAATDGNQATPTNNAENTGTQNNNNKGNNNRNTGANTGINNTDNQATPTDGSNTTNNDPASATQSNQENNQQQQQQDNNGNSKTPIIAGAVVGGLVAIASIVGVFTWFNRQDGGCTTRRHRRGIPRDDEAQIADFDSKMMAENNNSNGGSPFQHARRFVPPTSGYMNLADEDYNGDYHDPMYNHNEYHQSYQQVYLHSGQEYLTTADNAAYYNNTPTTASPTLIASPAPLVATGGVVPAYHTPMKPDQIDQKPNAA
ncbi:hypothetical protein K501DRAFT_284242 [Backusella circina FSU 941]|nr:hypothetical protein K501DRAFT_284242 [Backusella circina FSU 941]